MQGAFELSKSNGVVKFELQEPGFLHSGSAHQFLHLCRKSSCNLPLSRGASMKSRLASSKETAPSAIKPRDARHVTLISVLAGSGIVLVYIGLA